MSTLKHHNVLPMSNDGNDDKINFHFSPQIGTQGRNAQRNAQGDKRGGQNINHLLSFTLPPRSRPPLAGPARRSRRAGAGVPFNKERYVNAQYRFLVKPTGDYTAYFADPDIYLNWSDILQVIIPTTSALAGVGTSAPISDQPREPTHEGAACPICLSPPTAPRMTKCGHVFCYPCILHYLTLADGNAAGGSTGNAPSQKWRRCPICWDAVYARDLKAVRWWDPQAAAQEHEAKVKEEIALARAKQISQQKSDSQGKEEVDGEVQEHRDAEAPSSGDLLALRLIERPHVTTLALPQSSTWPASNLDHPLIAAHSAPWHFQPDVMGFAKFMLASPDLLIESLTQDLHELEEEIKVLRGFGTDELGLQFVNVAQKKVAEQIHKVQTELDLPIIRSTIGQAKNDLKDHEAAQAGKELRTDLSRRQRKKIEREQINDPTNQTNDDNTTAPSSDTEAQATAAESDGKPEDAAGAEEFLALRAQSQGGSNAYAREQSPLVEAGSDREKHDATKEGAAIHPGTGRSPKVRKNINPPLPGSSSYVFFQAASGQSIFLHPLDIKILLSHYGAYSKLPRNLSVKVGGADEGSMNEELRRRCKYLNHIPMAADVVFIEIDWEGMNVISKSTLKPYEQALRQRRNKRRDKERREDRAKTRAEEAELISSQGGPAAAAAYRRRQEELAAFTSEANFPSDGLSRSFGSHRGDALGGHTTDDARLSEFLTSPNVGGDSFSPSFRDSAMVGAEREFPIHPGAAGTEDFPDSLGVARGGLDRVSISSSDDQQRGETPDRRRSGHSTPLKKTVWGTPAASKSSFANAIQGRSNDASGLWDDQMEDAWHELEEDFILGSTGSGRRPSGAVKEGRGLNKQQSAQLGGYALLRRGSGGGVSSSGTKTPKRPESLGNQSGLDADGDDEKQNVSGTQSPATTTTGARSKKVKKKLILTGGGGGRGTR